MDAARALIIDASVLLDAVAEDLGVLRRIAALGSVHVASIVLVHINDLGQRARVADMLIVVEPSLDLMMEAARRSPGLSRGDSLTLLLAQRHGWTCLSHDACLMRACRERGVTVHTLSRVLALSNGL